ncbi:hypothetical protein BDA99DRAFT_562879 [Phascolomyces articulosus]|uniref:Rhodanese domain-containing protein n=1 Tax=Phascolomyces articulosus TaxID=60185 RepID=A0AAD5PAV5_9FUNG|nr:hypothetical protein BDA99DRAFT_562879 [Phascolomyces articulosus]
MPHNVDRKIKSVAIQRVIRDKKTSDTTWSCCDVEYSCHEVIGRHVHSQHTTDIEQWQDRLVKERQLKQQYTIDQANDEFRRRRTAKGSSDPITITNCNCNLDSCRVILFYKYVSVEDPIQYAQEHQDLCERLQLTGKVRISKEGLNITLAGSNSVVEQYLDWITTTPPFAIEEGDAYLSKERNNDYALLAERRYKFFKPSPGCRHVFADLSIKVVDEICPLGRPSMVGLDQLSEASGQVKKLEPQEFHEMLLEHQKKNQGTMVLLDTRNYYESRIGMFKDAITPAIRKFSRFPDYVDRNRESLNGKTIFTYCTGGIRCEKATAYMHQVLSDDTKIHMLKGGIHNYIEWCKRNDSNSPSLWLGKNYVFDARQALSLADETSSINVVGMCQGCQIPWDVYQKCGSVNCHLLVLYCTSCVMTAVDNKVYCCSDCSDNIRGDDGVCGCERKRRAEEMKPLSPATAIPSNIGI